MRSSKVLGVQYDQKWPGFISIFSSDFVQSLSSEILDLGPFLGVCLEKEMVTFSSIFAMWFLWMEAHPSMGLHRVGHYSLHQGQQQWWDGTPRGLKRQEEGWLLQPRDGECKAPLPGEGLCWRAKANCSHSPERNLGERINWPNTPPTHCSTVVSLW